MYDFAHDMANVTMLENIATTDNPIQVAIKSLLHLAGRRPSIVDVERVTQVQKEYFQMTQTLEELLHRVAHPDDTTGSGVTLAPGFEDRARLAATMSDASPAVVAPTHVPRFAEAVETWLGDFAGEHHLFEIPAYPRAASPVHTWRRLIVIGDSSVVYVNGAQ